MTGRVADLDAAVRVAESLARHARAGATVPEALAAIAPGALGAAGSAVRAVVAEARAGRPWVAVLEAWARSVPADRPELALLASTAAIAADAGAGAADAFDGVAVALSDLAELVDEATALTAQSQASLRLLSWLPVASACCAATLDHDVAAFYVTPPGAALVLGAASAVAVGRWWFGRLIAGVTA